MLRVLFEQGTVMIRKLLLPLVALLVLSGCASDYYYRGGSGDYYYGSPRSTYYYGAPYSSIGYGSPGGWYGGIGYGYGYGSPYRYGYRYGAPYYPYYPYYPRWRHHHRPPPKPPGEEHRPPQEGDRMTGGRQPPRRVAVPQPQQAGAMPPRAFRGQDGQPVMRPSRADGGMPGMQDRPMRRQSSQPLAPVRAESRPAPRMEALARPVHAPRMERREAPPGVRDQLE